MPLIGGIYVPDTQLPQLPPPPPPRPGLGAIFSSAAEQAYGNLRYGLPLEAETLAGTVTPQDQQFYNAGLARTSAPANTNAPASVQDVLSGRVSPVKFAIENLVASVPYTVGSIAGAAGGAALSTALAGPEAAPLGGIAGAIAAGTPQFVGSNVQRAVQEQGSLDQGAATRSLEAAPLQAASDVLFERFLPGASKLFGSFAAHQEGNLVRRIITNAVEAGATGAVTEPAQQVGERYAAGLPLSGSNAAAEYVGAAAAGFAAGGLIGAAGGIRRSPAEVKPAAAVSNDDMSQTVDQAILALPAPADFHVNPQGVASVNPSGTQVLALPPPERFTRTDMVVDAAGRATPAEGGVNPTVLANLPRAATPPLELQPQQAENTILAGILGAQASLQPTTQPATSVAALTGTPVGETQLPQVAQRPFASEPIADLNTVLKQAADAEAKGKPYDPQLLDLVRAEVAARGREAVGAEPVSGDDFQKRLDDMKHGLRGGFVQNITADNPADLLNKVYDQIFTEQDERSNTVKFAQRLGILDADGEPGPEALRIETQRAEAAQTEPQPVVAEKPEATEPQGVGAKEAPPPAVPPITPENPTSSLQNPDLSQNIAENAPPSAEPTEFMQSARFQELRPPRADKAFKALRPTSEEDLRAQVVNALNTQRASATTQDNLSPQIEELGQKLGLLTNDEAKDFTPLARETYLKSSEGLDEIVSAAQDQGYDGRLASVFDRGARTQLGGEEAAKFDNFEDLAAYQAGKVWAKNFVENTGSERTKTAAETQATMRSIRGNLNPSEVEQRGLAPGQVQQQALNQLLGAANLRSASESDIAGLYRMVREGASPLEVGQKLQQVQGGKSLFEEAPRQEPAPLPPLPARGQPRFQEAAPVEPTKAAQRAETQAALAEKARHDALRQEIDAAYASQDITAPERIALLHRLVQRDYTGVANRLPGGPLRNDLRAPDPRVVARATSALAGTLSPTEAKVETLPRTPGARTFQMLVKSGNVQATLEHLAQHSADPAYRQLARRLVNAGGWDRVKLTFDPENRRGLYGRASLLDDGTSAISIYGDKGLSEETLLHEAIHAFIQQRWAGIQLYTPELRRQAGVQLDRHNASLDSFTKLWSEISRALLDTNSKLADPQLWSGQFLSNPDEALAWVLTNKQAQAYLKSVDETGAKVSVGSSLWSRFVHWVSGLLGARISTSETSALSKLLDASNAILDAGKDVRADGFGAQYANAVSGSTALVEQAHATTAPDTNEVTERVARGIANVVDKLDTRGIKNWVRRNGIGLISTNQINRAYGDNVPGIRENKAAHDAFAAIRTKMELVGENVVQNLDRLRNSKVEQDRKDATRISELMSVAQFGIDGAKSWEDHAFLHGEPNAADLKDLWVKASGDYRTLERHGRVGLFEEARAANEAQNLAGMAGQLRDLVARDEEYTKGIVGSGESPGEKFLAANLSSAAEVRKFWRDDLDARIKDSRDFVQQVLGGTDRAAKERISALQGLLARIQENLASMERRPYFHVGRFGDHFAAFVLRKEGKVVDPAAVRRAAQLIQAAGFTDVQLSTDNTNPRVMIRTDDESQAERLRQIGLQLETEGVAEKDSTQYGPRTPTDNFGLGATMPGYLNTLIEELKNSPVFQEAEWMTPAEQDAVRAHRDEAMRLAVDAWLNAQPDNSIARVLATRKLVQGASTDMMRAFAHRQNVGAAHIASVLTRPDFTAARRMMTAGVDEAKQGGNQLDPYERSQVVREIMRRDATDPIRPTGDTFDRIRAYAHAYYLGLQVSSGFINLSSLGVTVLPELAKRNSYVASFHAMRRASVQAFKILSAVNSQSRAQGLRHAVDLQLTENALQQANIPADVRDFVRHMVATGKLDIGTMARALGQVAGGRGDTATDVALRYGTAVNLYTEVFSRLTAAIAARELHGPGEGVHDYAAQVVNNSLFDFQSRNTARLLGRNGILGPVTPLVTQFMQWNLQLTEKLYSELRQGFFDRAATDAEKTAARRFLAGHLTAITALAGTLGLPFATVFASLLERMFGSDDEPFDATASWRDFLSSVLGRDVGEVVARGLPRAAGFDISQRAGEASILPFSEFLADRRSWRDSVQNSVGRSIGAAPNMLLSIAEGGDKFANGDVLGGLKEMLPAALKNEVEAYRMTEQGYVDTNGNQLPMTPGAKAIMWQLLGFTPAEKAEYSEARVDQMVRRGELSRAAGDLRQRIIGALVQGDQGKARDLVTQAIGFDQKNPSFAVIPSLASALAGQQQARAQAVALHTPIGVSVKDLAGQSLTQYANMRLTQ